MNHSGELDLTYNVSVFDPETRKETVLRGTGYGAVARFAEIAEGGHPRGGKDRESVGKQLLRHFQG